MNERTDTSEWPQLRVRVNPAVWEPWLELLRSEIPQAGPAVAVDTAVSIALKVRRQGAKSLLERAEAVAVLVKADIPVEKAVEIVALLMRSE